MCGLDNFCIPKDLVSSLLFEILENSFMKELKIVHRRLRRKMNFISGLFEDLQGRTFVLFEYSEKSI